MAVTTQPPKEESLPQLAERLQAREAGALEKLIGRTQSACSRLAVSILKDPELSRDALQEAYFVVFQRIGQLRDCNAIKSWLLRIVTHCCHDILRRRGKEFQADIEVAVAAPDLAEGIGRQETIRATFAQLPEIDRTTLARPSSVDPGEFLPFSYAARQLAPATHKVQTQFMCSLARFEALKTVVALEIFQREHGTYPERLEQLVPKILPELPREVMSPKVWSKKPTLAYRRLGSKYELISESPLYAMLRFKGRQSYGPDGNYEVERMP
ncbi:MAG: hypothetical protein KF760_03640 [Candidatus Eremiobacteraeota bacterium]|nr:hypothetical protein [Candidatus Eremiobacteraeota bacterium]